MASKIEPLFRLISDELLQSTDHKVKALSHAADLHELIRKTIEWDEHFIKALCEVFNKAEATEPDALDAGIPEIVKQFGNGKQAAAKEN